MNGPVYISFFQGQLESVLEQVVHLAVQEISKTVGCSLNNLLLETASKEQENRRLRVQIQTEQEQCGVGREKAREGNQGTGLKSVPRAKEGHSRPAEQNQNRPGEQNQSTAAKGQSRAGTQGLDCGLRCDSRRLEQRGRVVEQLKCVMQRVLDFALSELTKIVEASFDDLLLEITKMESEQKSLLERSMERRLNHDRRGSENESVSPSDEEEVREEEEDREDLPWVPILDKVFGQKWCGEAWSTDGVTTETGVGGRGSTLAPPLSLDPRPSSPQTDPRWTPLEDMEVFSPDDDANVATATESAQPTSATPTATCSGSVHSPKAASMLHRLLTLPSQLLDDEDADDGELETISMVTEAALATEAPSSLMSPTATRDEEEEEEEEGRRKKKRRRVWTECEDCGRRFSRISLLKTHRQTHQSETHQGESATLSCGTCGKRFSSQTRLQSHIHTSHGASHGASHGVTQA